MVLSPLAKAILPDAVPEVTAVPFTVTVELGSWVTGVTVTEVRELGTVVVYVVTVPVVPVLVNTEAGVNLIELSKATFDSLVTVIV